MSSFKIRLACTDCHKTEEMDLDFFICSLQAIAETNETNPPAEGYERIANFRCDPCTVKAFGYSIGGACLN